MARPFTPSPMFPAAKAHAEAINDALAAASARLRAVPGIGSGTMGLTPDAVRATPAYRQAKAAYDHWHAIARNFNRDYCVMFKRELAAERAERRAAGRL